MKAKNRYEIKNVIARGGMGIVYRAQDKMINRLVALKTIHDLSDPRAIRMFQREWQDLASLSHPNIVEVFDVGEIEVDGENRPYLVMPLLPGVTLDELIKSASQRLTVERSIDIIAQTSRGLQAAHDRGIVHRDLKPSNIFVMPDDAVKIIDFGVAGRLDTTKTLGRKGTLLYMSPEQLENKPISAVSDMFALSVVCYETLTRRKPFERATEEEVVEAIRKWTPPPVSEFNPGVNAMLSQVIQKGMAKQARHRFASAREFSDTLQKALRNEPIESLNPAKIQGRLQRAQGAFDRGDLALADEIVGELEAEGHFDPAIAELKQRVTHAQIDHEVIQLLQSARIREEQQEHQLALQKIHEILQISPHHTEALAIKSRIDNRRTEADIEEWFRVSHQHLDNFAYSHAREALQRILQLRSREPRALQMLSEVDRREQSYVQLRQQKEELYRAAVEAAQNGEISQALSKAERVLELDRQAPELIEPGRTMSYQSFYNSVRSESESLKAAYQEARAYLANRNHAAALAICDAQLSRHPNYALFQALRVDIEEQRRQALSSRIAEIDRAVEADPDLNSRINLIEGALQEYPGEPHFQRALQLTHHRRGLVDSIVAKARAHEERGQFGEAITQWETLNTIHSVYPGIALELERLRKRRIQQERVDRKSHWVQQIERNLERNEFVAALETVRKALEDFPGDAELAELGKLAEHGLERSEESKRLFDAGREAYEAQRHEEATTLLRRAMELDDRNPAVRSMLIETLVRRAQNAHEQEPLAAETILREALDIEPNHALAKGLLSLIRDQHRAARIEQCVSHARQLQNENDLRGALNEVDQMLSQYQDDARLAQLRETLQKALRDERRRDLEEARRLQVADSTLDPRTAGEMTSRLEVIVSRYQDDGEFRPLIAGARSRLQPVTHSSATQPTHPVNTLNTAALPAAMRRKPGAPVNLRSPWILGGAAGLLLAVSVLPFVLRSHKKAPVAVATAPAVPVVPTVPVQTALPAATETLLTIVGTGKFEFDGGERQSVETIFAHPVSLGGGHLINAFVGNTGNLRLSFTAVSGQLPVVKILNDHDMLAFLVGTSEEKMTLFSSHKIASLRIDGKPLGDLGPEGLPVSPDLAGSNHRLEWMEGQELKSRDLQFQRGPGLLVQLNSDPNLGHVVITLRVPGTVDLTIHSAGAKDISATTTSGQWSSPLRAGVYTIEASPRQGYERKVVPVTIRKNEDQAVVMDFKKMILPAHLLIVTVPRAHISKNGTAIGDADDTGKFAVQSEQPGHYRYTASLAGYLDATEERDLVEGQNPNMELKLTRPPGTVVLTREPANAVVTWSRVGDSRWEPFVGNSRDFPEGQYAFRGTADGYIDSDTGTVTVQSGRPNPVTVRLVAKSRPAETKTGPTSVDNPCAGWSGGEPENGLCKLSTQGYSAYGPSIDGRRVEFEVLTNGKPVKWQIGDRAGREYWEFELTAKSLKVTEQAKGKKRQPDLNANFDLMKPHKIIFTVNPRALVVEIPEAGLNKSYTDPQSDFHGSFRVEVKKSQPVSVRIR